MPSTMSSSVSRLFASSTVMTPSLPTFCIACAIISPISRSSLAEIVPIWAISALVETFFEPFLRAPTTASTSISMPRSIRSRASPLTLTSLAAMFALQWLSSFLIRDGVINHTQDVRFLHDHEVLAVELHFGARPLAEQHAVAGLDVERVQLAILVARAGADGDDFAFHRLFLRRVRH